MFCAWSNASRPPANLLTREAPSRASSVFPAATPSEVRGVPAVVRLARNAPRSTPGQTRVPMSKRAARAIPVGGQTAVALAFRNARVRPSLAAVKYNAARPAIAATVFPTFKIGGRSRTLLRILGRACQSPSLERLWSVRGDRTALLPRNPTEPGAGFVRLAWRQGGIRVLRPAKLIGCASPHLHVARPVVCADLGCPLPRVLVAGLHGSVHGTCDEHENQQPDQRAHGMIPPLRSICPGPYPCPGFCRRGKSTMRLPTTPWPPDPGE